VYNRDDVIRFWSKVDFREDHECWPWTGTTIADGRGMFQVGGKSVVAARVCLRVCGEVIPTGKYVLHRCDNPNCINPRHLYIGTAQDNINDAKDRGPARGVRVGAPLGEKHGRSKLTAEGVRDIRRRYSQGETKTVIAKRYDVSLSTISGVLSGRVWSHVQ